MNMAILKAKTGQSNLKIIIGSPDPSFNPIELDVGKRYIIFEKEYYDINEKDLPQRVYCYARDVIGGRWKKAEPIIMQDAQWTYYYAKVIVRGRWKKAEPIIMKNPEYAYWYARDIIRGKWPEAEPTIKNTKWAYWYENLHRWK